VTPQNAAALCFVFFTSCITLGFALGPSAQTQKALEARASRAFDEL
jgi:hypothetical protein